MNIFFNFYIELDSYFLQKGIKFTRKYNQFMVLYY